MIVAGTYQTLTSRDLNTPVTKNRVIEPCPGPIRPSLAATLERWACAHVSTKWLLVDRVRDPFDIDWSRPYDVGSAQISYQTRTGNPRQCSTLLSYGPQNVRTLRSQPCERSDQNQRPTVLTVLTSVSHPATETTPPEVGLFMHKWRTDLLSSEVLGPAETVASCSISFSADGNCPLHWCNIGRVSYDKFTLIVQIPSGHQT